MLLLKTNREALAVDIAVGVEVGVDFSSIVYMTFFAYFDERNQPSSVARLLVLFKFILVQALSNFVTGLPVAMIVVYFTVIWYSSIATSIRDRSQFEAMLIQRTFPNAGRLDTRIKH